MNVQHSHCIQKCMRACASELDMISSFFNVVQVRFKFYIQLAFGSYHSSMKWPRFIVEYLLIITMTE